MTDTKVIYERPKSLKKVANHYCGGCGHGIVHRIITELIDEMNLRDSMIFVAPVGCAVLAYDYLDVDSCEAAHGRAPAVATGIKRSRPDTNVVMYQGDGDLASIGMAEIIHAANRGEKITSFFINNAIYGMTGGQMAPTTLPGQRTSTCPSGREVDTMGAPMRICEMLDILDSPYMIARSSLHNVAGIRTTKKYMREALQNQIDGHPFSFVEILSPCPTYWRMSPCDALDYIGTAMVEAFPPKVFRQNGERKS